MIGGRRREGGSITVFLSLTLLVIMSLLGTMTEVARGKACRVYGRRTMRTAVDSLLTEYSRPLYDMYHLFFIENAGKPFRQSIAEYAAGTVNPDVIDAGRLDFYDAALGDVTVTEERYAGDEGGVAIREQITEYMKRSLASDAAQKLLGKTKPLEQLEETAKEIDQKVSEQKQDAEESCHVLELMRLVDGVDCSDSRIKGQEVFVKMFFHGKKQAERFGITEPVVWNAMKGNIVELQTYFGRMQKNTGMKQRFAGMVSQADKKTAEALKLVDQLGDRLERWNISGDAAAILRSNRSILRQTGEYLRQPLTDEVMAELKKMWKRYNTSGIVFDYAGINEKGGAENPIDCFSNAISGGLTKLVLEKSAPVSKKKVKNANHYQTLNKNGKVAQGVEDDRLKAFAEKSDVELTGAVKGIARAEVSDVMMCQYMKKYFSSAVKCVGTEKKRLDYEWEYILCGGGSDKENLDKTIGRLVLLRSIINTTAIFSSSAKRDTAYAAALAVVGFTGMEPLIRLTQTLFIILWGTAEALVDAAAILQDREVPLFKTGKNVVVEFSELYQISNPYIMKKVAGYPKADGHSVGYEEYMMLMMKGMEEERQHYRMMDLMEWNIRDNREPKFNFGICVDSFQVTGEFLYNTKFFHMSFLQNIIDRKLNCFRQRITLEARYTKAVAQSG